MKEMYFFLCSFILFIFNSCDDNIRDEVLNKNLTNSFPALLTDSVHVTSDGAIQFSSASSYFEVLDLISEMSDEELDKWENTIGFHSMRKSINDVLNKSLSIKTPEGITQLSSQHPHLITIGERGIEPLIKVPFYRSIINEDGCFYVSTVKHQIIGNELAITAYNDLSTRSVEHEIKIPYLEESSETRAPGLPTTQFGATSGSIAQIVGSRMDGSRNYEYCVETKYTFARNLISSKKGKQQATGADEYTLNYNYVLTLQASYKRWGEGYGTWSYCTPISSFYMKDINYKIQGSSSSYLSQISDGNSYLIKKELKTEVTQISDLPDAQSYMHRLEYLNYGAQCNEFPNHVIKVSYSPNIETPDELSSISGVNAILVGKTGAYSVSLGYDAYQWVIPNGCTINSTTSRNTAITFNQSGTYTIACRAKKDGMFTNWVYKTITVIRLTPPYIYQKQVKILYANQMTPLFSLGNNKYEWIFPNDFEVSFADDNRNKVSAKFSRTGTYQIKVRTVASVYGVNYYSEWVEIELYVIAKPCSVVYEVSKTHFVKYYGDRDLQCGAAGSDSPAYFMPEGGDAPYPGFLIGTDPYNTDIKYYYTVKGREYWAEDGIRADPVETCEFTYAFPGTETPAETVTVYYE